MPRSLIVFSAAGRISEAAPGFLVDLWVVPKLRWQIFNIIGKYWTSCPHYFLVTTFMKLVYHSQYLYCFSAFVLLIQLFFFFLLTKFFNCTSYAKSLKVNSVQEACNKCFAVHFYKLKSCKPHESTTKKHQNAKPLVKK